MGNNDSPNKLQINQQMEPPAYGGPQTVLCQFSYVKFCSMFCRINLAVFLAHIEHQTSLGQISDAST